MSLVFERVRAVTADILQLPLERITPHSSPHTIGNWDSIQHLNLILALEQEFKLEFEPEEFDQMNSLKKITLLVESKLLHDA